MERTDRELTLKMKERLTEIIRCAERGGYFKNITDDGSRMIGLDYEPNEGGKISIAFFNKETDRFYFNLYNFFCDPLFWKAIGIDSGWGMSKNIFTGKKILVRSTVYAEKAMIFHQINMSDEKTGFEKAIEYLYLSIGRY